MREYIFLLLVPVAIGGKYFLENLNSFTTQMQGVIFTALALLIMVIPIYSLSGSEDVLRDDELEEEPENESIELEEIQASQKVEHEDEPQKVENFKEYITVNFSNYYIEPLLALGLIIGFFLPWMDLIIAKLNLYEILKQNEIGEASLLWLIVIFSTVLILTSRFHKDLRLLTLITGLTPYILIITAMVKYGDGSNPFKDMEVLSYGFYLTYIIALIMIVRSLYRMVKEKSILNLGEQKEEKVVPIKIKVKWINAFIGVGIIISFFLPWANIFITYSGYALWMDGLSTYIVFIPLFAFFLIIATLQGDLVIFPTISALLPFILLFVESSDNSKNIFSLLSFGGYLTLLLSLALLVLTLFRKHFFLLNNGLEIEMKDKK